MHTFALLFCTGSAFLIPLGLRLWWVSGASSWAAPATASVAAAGEVVPSKSHSSADWATLWTDVIQSRSRQGNQVESSTSQWLGPAPDDRGADGESTVSQASWLAPTSASSLMASSASAATSRASGANRAVAAGGPVAGSAAIEFRGFLLKLFAATAGVLTLSVVVLRFSNSLGSAGKRERELVVTDAIAISRDAGVKLIRVGNQQFVVGHDRGGLRGMVLLPPSFGSMLDQMQQAETVEEALGAADLALASRAGRNCQAHRYDSFTQPEDQGWDLSQPIS